MFCPIRTPQSALAVSHDRLDGLPLQELEPPPTIVSGDVIQQRVVVIRYRFRAIFSNRGGETERTVGWIKKWQCGSSLIVKEMQHNPAG
jgi:hypothetical protein